MSALGHPATCRSATSRSRVSPSRHSVPGRPNGVMNHAAHGGNKPRAETARSWQAGQWHVVLREEIEVAGRAFEDAKVPIPVLFQASGRLDHRSTAVRTGWGFGHRSRPSALDP